jgi:hypothetical protein
MTAIIWAVLSTLCLDGVCDTMVSPIPPGMNRVDAERVAATMREGGATAEVIEYGTVSDGKFTPARTMQQH